MHRVDAEALVGAPPGEVWKLYDNIVDMPRWVSSVEEVVYLSGPARVGTVYRERTRLGLMRAVGQWEIVEHRRPVRQVRTSTARGLESRRIITFERRGTGTLVHEAAEIRSSLPGPVGWLHEAIASFGAARGVHAAVAGAKRMFEGEPG